MYTDLDMALKDADDLTMKYRKDFALTWYKGKFHVLEHGSGYNDHMVLEVFRAPDFYTFPRERR